MPSAIPPVDQCWDTPRRWAHLRVGCWKWAKEHINIKEGRASLFGLRRATRTRHNHGKRVASLGDNLVSICAFEKGRAKSWALNSLARRAAGYQIAARVRWHSRHIESKRNAADAGSRLHQSGGSADRSSHHVEPRPERDPESCSHGSADPPAATPVKPLGGRGPLRAAVPGKETVALELFPGEAGLTWAL